MMIGEREWWRGVLLVFKNVILALSTCLYMSFLPLLGHACGSGERAGRGGRDVERDRACVVPVLVPLSNKCSL